ncbi:hypothetical protein OAO01_05345 [Oligoflexia bacterium]|nr:hypothetical protein [Oligoflexia bacterium]
MQRRLLKISSLSLFLFFISAVTLVCATAWAKTLEDPATGLQVEAPNKYQLTYNGDSTYTIKKKNSKTKANFVIGTTPLSAKLTADDFINASGMAVSKYSELDDSVLLAGKLGKKNVQVRFRPVGEVMEVVTYFGNNKKNKKSKKKKKKKKKKGGKKKTARQALSNQVASLTLAEINILDQIIRSRQGGTVVPLPVTIPVRKLTGADGTSAVVPDLPGWSFAAKDGIISGGNPSQGIVNLGIPSLVILPGFPHYGISNSFVSAEAAIAQVWPQAVATLGAQVQVLGVQAVPGTNGWLGTTFASSGMFGVQFQTLGRTWQALFVSGGVPIDAFSWFWYYSYIAVPVGSSPAIGNALMNTWATWDNSAASAKRLQDALNTIKNTVVPGNPIDPEVFDAIHQKWTDYIRS